MSMIANNAKSSRWIGSPRGSCRSNPAVSYTGSVHGSCYLPKNAVLFGRAVIAASMPPGVEHAETCGQFVAVPGDRRADAPGR